MSDHSYISLITSFLDLSAPGQPPLSEDPGALHFTIDDVTCTVFPLEGGRQLVVHCPVVGLAEIGAAHNASLLRLLHGLNWAAREGTGIMALVDSDDQVLVSKVMEIDKTDAHQLQQMMADLLEAAAQLGTMLKVSEQAILPPRSAVTNRYAQASKKEAR